MLKQWDKRLLGMNRKGRRRGVGDLRVTLWRCFGVRKRHQLDGTEEVGSREGAFNRWKFRSSCHCVESFLHQFPFCKMIRLVFEILSNEMLDPTWAIQVLTEKLSILTEK